MSNEPPNRQNRLQAPRLLRVPPARFRRVRGDRWQLYQRAAADQGSVRVAGVAAEERRMIREALTGFAAVAALVLLLGLAGGYQDDLVMQKNLCAHNPKPEFCKDEIR